MVIDRKQDMFFVLLEQTPTRTRSASSARSKQLVYEAHGELTACARALLLSRRRWRARSAPAAPDREREPESAGAARAAFHAQAFERVGDYIRNEIATGKIPGAILLIQQHGKPVYFESFGVRDVATKLPMTPDTIFQHLFDVEGRSPRSPR